MDQALGSISSASAHNALRSMISNAQVKLLGLMQTSPVPSLITTSNSSQKLSNGALLHQLSTSNMPPLRPKLLSCNRSSHEIITIGDSSITKNPPPLLSTPSTGLTGLQSHESPLPLPRIPSRSQLSLPLAELIPNASISHNGYCGKLKVSQNIVRNTFMEKILHKKEG